MFSLPLVEGPTLWPIAAAAGLAAGAGVALGWLDARLRKATSVRRVERPEELRRAA